MELSDALRYDFTGSPASRQFTRLGNSAHLRDTVVADAGSYVGVTPLQKAAALGDFTIIAKTIMTQIVPSAQSETPIPATIPYAAAGFPVSAAEAVTFSTSQTWNTTTSLALPGGCLPGSLSIVVGGVTFTDKGGILMSGTQQIGLVDYANGIVTSSSGSYDGSKTISYRPAAYMQRMPQSSEIRITAENRSQSYTGFITPLPARGTLSFSYRAQGRWYVLSDSGDGALRGTDSSYGAGTYSAETGSFVVTLGALPDVGSSIVQHWGVPTQETVQPAADLLISQTIALALPAGQALYPGAFDIKWMDGQTQRTATATAAWQLQGMPRARCGWAAPKCCLRPSCCPPWARCSMSRSTRPLRSRSICSIHPATARAVWRSRQARGAGAIHGRGGVEHPDRPERARSLHPRPAQGNGRDAGRPDPDRPR
jgi:hypothetical protein